MTQKTKAEKIAASLRAKRNIESASVLSQSRTPYTAQTATTSPGGSIAEDTGVHVYVIGDLRKTIVVTLCVISLLTLVYVLQYKGYF